MILNDHELALYNFGCGANSHLAMWMLHKICNFKKSFKTCYTFNLK